jgi:cytochrome b561
MDTTPRKNAISHAMPYIEQYGFIAKSFHWITAILILVVAPIAWYMDTIDKADPARAYWHTMHRSIGLTILALTILRVIWLRIAPPPPMDEAMARIQKILAHATHGLLYLVLLAMPISGYLMSAAKGREISFFWLYTMPQLTPINEQLAHFSHELHETGQWALFALLGVHVLSALFHGVILKDGMAYRMVPSRSRR